MGGGCSRHAYSRTCMIIYSSSHPYNAGADHVGFSPNRQTLLAPSAKRWGGGSSAQPCLKSATITADDLDHIVDFLDHMGDYLDHTVR